MLTALSAAISHATILTFEDFTSSNINLPAVANPFGAGPYGSRANSPVNAGFQQGDSWTPNVVLAWSNGWQTFIGWPFGNDATTGAGKVAQADFNSSGGAPLDITFTPDTGFGVVVKSFAFTVWNASPELPVQIQWTVFGGTAISENVLATGTSNAAGTSGGAQTIPTGLTQVHSGASPVILRWEKLSGDGTYIAINNLHFAQGPAKIAPQLAWPLPDAVIEGSALGGTQLSATADVPGTFSYTPAAATVLPAGSHTLTANFTPADAVTYSTGTITTTLLVKADNVPVISVAPPLKIASVTPLSSSLFQTSSDVRGSFSLSPPAGTVLPLGTHTVTVTFTPENSAFQTVSRDATLEVVALVPEGTVWTFEDPANRLRPVCGDDILAYYDPNATNWAALKISFGSAASFGLPLPEGRESQVMRFANSLLTEGFKIDFNDPPNGTFLESGKLSNYTLIFDVLYPASSHGAVKPLFNAHAGNANGAEALVSAASPNAVQVRSMSYGEVKPDTWHRISIVVRSAPAEGQVHVYVDGTFIGGIGSNDSLISANYALEDALLLLTSNTGNGGTGYLSGLRFIGRNLDYSEIHTLGRVNSDGPHVAGPPGPGPPFQPQRDVINIGHRGNGGFAPEDTMPSFTSAFAAGADVVEIDIRRTSDNRVVVIHDPVVDRTTNGTGSVASMTLAQMQALDAGSWFGPQFAGTPPPALRDVMAAVKDAYPAGILYLDCKVNGLAPLAKADADATGFPNERFWFWVYDQTSEAAAYRSTFPNAKIIWGEGNWHNGASISSWPSLTAAQKQAVVTGMKARGVYGFDFGDNEMNSLNPTTLQELRAAGFLVSAYSALHPRSMNSAIEHLGVDAMETDFPPVLRDLMPMYITIASATALSDGAVEITWPSFPGSPLVDQIKVRAKRKAAAPSTWAPVAAGLSPNARLAVAGGLPAGTLYEFQPIGYDASGAPIAFGSVAETSTFTAGQNFTAAYQAWQSANPGVGSAAEDTDGDGLSNLFEYSGNLDPLDSSLPGGSFLTVTGALSVQFTRPAGRFVLWRCEASTDLQTWTPLLPLVECDEEIIEARALSDVVKVSAPPPDGASRWFLRLRLSPVP
ncbi:MAG: glycerophosphodiester phosphodiesterase [Verrucomicrobiales bacterium]